jgi:hypothetical protein
MQEYLIAFTPLLIGAVAVVIGLPIGLYFASRERAEQAAKQGNGMISGRVRPSPSASR